VPYYCLSFGKKGNIIKSNRAPKPRAIGERRALDAATRHQGQVAAQVVFMQDMPSLPLFFRPKIAVAVPRLTGLQLDSTAGSILWNVESLNLAAP
jgi:hypothetical protein